MYQVLYRKWRPRTFSDVSGQAHITATLRNEIRRDHLAHAYLFTGSRGTGKTSCAKILAKAVNCLHPVDGNPCCECEICKGIDNGTVLDIEEIDAASNNGVDNIRSLREEVNFTPTAGKYRVYIIDEVHMLSTGAFNALLKTLEEPPAHVIFILATTEVHKVPATVLSRCQRFDFYRISTPDIAARLQYVAKEEGLNLQPEAAELIARLADGGMRDALSMLDRCVGEQDITVEWVNRIIGLAGNQSLFALSDAIAGNRLEEALRTVEQLHGESRDMTLLCNQLIGHFRNFMLAKAVKNPGELILCPPEELRLYMNGAETMTMDRIFGVLSGLQQAADRMNGSNDRRIELEMALIRLMSLPEEPARPAVAAAPVETPAPQPQPSQPAPAVDLPWREDPAVQAAEQAAERYREEIPLPEPPEEEPARPEPQPPAVKEDGFFVPWPEVLVAVSAKNRMMGAVLKGSDAFLEGDILRIRAEHPQFVELIRQPENRNIVKDAVQAVTGQTYRLGPYQEPAVQNDPLQAFVQQLQGKTDLHNLDQTE